MIGAFMLVMLPVIFCTIFATYLIPKRLVSDGDPVVPLIVLLGTFCGVAVAFFMFSALEGKNDPTGFTSYTEQFALKDFSTRDGELFFNGTKGEFTHCKLQNVSVLVKKDLSGTFIEAKSSFGSTLMGTADSTIIFVASESEKRDWEKFLSSQITPRKVVP